MRLTRRNLIAGTGGIAVARAQQSPRPETPRPRNTPLIAICSQHLSRLTYYELAPVVKTMGFEGCDLTVRPGGHVQPQHAPVDLNRAIESLRGEGVEVPMITTAFTTVNDPWARTVLAIAGGMGVQFFQPGYWTWNGALDVEARLAEVKRDVVGLAMMARAYRIGLGLHNQAGDFVGSAIWDTRSLLAELDPRLAGYCLDPGQAMAEGAGGGWNAALRLALPRLKMLVVRDFTWVKDGGQWKPKLCPLGEGMVEWPRIFALLAQARFTGPVSLRVEYEPKDELAAIARDFDYLRKQVGVAWGSVS